MSWTCSGFSTRLTHIHFAGHYFSMRADWSQICKWVRVSQTNTVSLPSSRPSGWFRATDNNDNKQAVIFTPVPPALQLDLQRKHSAARLDLMSSCWCLSVISNSPLALRTALHKAIKHRNMTHSVSVCVLLFCSHSDCLHSHYKAD